MRRGLAYSVGSQYSPHLDTGILRIYAGVDSESGKDAVGVILEQLAEIREKLVPDDELRRAKDFYKGSLSLRLEDTLSLALRHGGHMVLSGKIISVEEVLERIEAVTSDEIQDVAKDLLRKEKLSLAAVGPFEGEDEMMGVVGSSVL